MRLFIAVLLGVLAVSSLAGGCGKILYSRQDLEIDLSRHHIDLRWGRLENAAQRVHPDMRGEFLSHWAARMGNLELQDIELAGVVMAEDGDSADVIVNVTWITRDTMRVQTVAITEKWQRTDDGWRAIRPVELPIPPSG